MDKTKQATYKLFIGNRLAIDFNKMIQFHMEKTDLVWQIKRLTEKLKRVRPSDQNRFNDPTDFEVNNEQNKKDQPNK